MEFSPDNLFQPPEPNPSLEESQSTLLEADQPIQSNTERGDKSCALNREQETQRKPKGSPEIMDKTSRNHNSSLPARTTDGTPENRTQSNQTTLQNRGGYLFICLR